MPQVTQIKYEELDVAAQHYRAWLAHRAAEHALFEARRARREAEVFE